MQYVKMCMCQISPFPTIGLAGAGPTPESRTLLYLVPTVPLSFCHRYVPRYAVVILALMLMRRLVSAAKSCSQIALTSTVDVRRFNLYSCVVSMDERLREGREGEVHIHIERKINTKRSACPGSFPDYEVHTYYAFVYNSQQSSTCTYERRLSF